MLPFLVIVATHPRLGFIGEVPTPSESDSSLGVAPIPHPRFPKSFPCRTSENSPVSPAIATDPEAPFSKSCVCHTSETPGEVSFEPTGSSPSLLPPIPLSHLPAIPFIFRHLHTLLHLPKPQLLRFQAIAHSLPKTTRGGGRSVLLASRLLTPAGGPHGFIHIPGGLFAGITLALVAMLKILKIVLENFRASLVQAFSGGIIQRGFGLLLGRAVRMLPEPHDRSVSAPIVLALPVALTLHLLVQRINQQIVCPEDKRNPHDPQNHEPLEHRTETPSPKF